MWTVNGSVQRFGAAGLTELDRGTLAVVWQPFSTGLTDATLVGRFPWLANVRPAGTYSWAQAIDAGLERLLSALRPGLAVGRYEDDLDGSQFGRLHALATVIGICDDLAGRGQPRNDARAQAQADFDREFPLAVNRLIWLDLNQDGEVEDGEQDAAQGLVSAKWTATQPDGDADPVLPRATMRGAR